ncbi:hypothetical protein BDV97DRAFT_90828 [Delphinella strobiligena]|nr:hypothetical protein BDV97DRAFT_90828 [Delphinella strobiligena]
MPGIVQENSQEEKIEAYFNRSLFAGVVTRNDCDTVARALGGNPITSVGAQGLCSYTVIAGPRQDTIVHFREETLGKVNTDNIEQAYQIHGSIVPRCKKFGSIGMLKILTMPKIPGSAYSDKCYKRTGPLPADVRATLDSNTEFFSRFFAESWLCSTKAKEHSPRVDELKGFIHYEMENFSNTLPPRHAEYLMKIKDELDILFAEDCAYVLTHLDLLPWNILVNDENHITGIIDWWDAGIMPFGVALHGFFFNMMGWMDKDGWHFYPCHRETEKLFWDTFETIVGTLTYKEKRAMEIAQMVGYYLRYGSTWDESLGKNGAYRPSRDGDEKLAYLDAIVEWTVSKESPIWSAPGDVPALTNGVDRILEQMNGLDF